MGAKRWVVETDDWHAVYAGDIYLPSSHLETTEVCLHTMRRWTTTNPSVLWPCFSASSSDGDRRFDRCCGETNTDSVKSDMIVILSLEVCSISAIITLIRKAVQPLGFSNRRDHTLRVAARWIWNKSL